MTTDLSKVDLHCEKNNEAHRTSEISTKRLIIRRAQVFVLTLHSSKENVLKPESLELTVQTGSGASEDLGTKSVFGVARKSLSKKPWFAKVSKSTAKSLSLHIASPADACIGEYTLSVKTHPDKKEGHSAGFVLLFNPWCKQDGVYLANEEERQEYVLSEQGVLYRGSKKYISDLAWDFGQFEEDILDICLKLLDLSPKCLENAAEHFSKRWDPIFVGREISAMINCNGDRGVLQGNWSGSYFGGVSPSHWNGSVDILRKWKESDCHPVKYGQCWVFGAVMCTAMRCLGIPCRPISNFQSAHDTHGNLLIDEFYSDHGVEPKESSDSIWNYHVWVEGWMKRPDLPGEPSFYDGWQVLDPTPQELSKGVYCCGPASVKAIHEGHTDMLYDVPFVFSEVNADQVTWLLKADGSKKKIFWQTDYVGHCISTKSVGSDERLDITENYKFPEGTKEERKVFTDALARCTTLNVPPSGPDVPPPEISIKIEEGSKPVFGKDIDLEIRLHCPKSRKLMLHSNAQVIFYNGPVESTICSEEKPIELQADKELTVPFQIPFSKYVSHMQGNNSIKVTVIADDQENSEEAYLAERNIVPRDPPFSITVTGEPVQYSPLMAEVVFDNPTEENLTDCSITITASGLIRRTAEAKVDLLGPGQRVRVRMPFRPYKAGLKKLVANFDCQQFHDIKTSCNIIVKPSSPA